MPDTEVATSPNMKLTIAGFQFELEHAYKDGDVINANEAAALNQTFAENIRNNFAAQLKAMKNKVARANGWVTKDEDGKETVDWERVTNDDLDADEVQTAYDEYVQSYEFGARRVGASRGPVDPVEREATRVAKDLVKKLLASKGYKLSTVSKEQMDSFVAQALEANPSIREAAQRTVDANKGISLEGLSI